MALVAPGRHHRMAKSVQQQAPIGKAGEWVVKRQALNVSLCLFAGMDVASNATVTPKNALGIQNGDPADGHPHGGAVRARTQQFKVLKTRMGLQY